MMRGLAWAMLALSLSAQQQPQQAAAPNAAVSGVVKDFGTGQPLANYNVSTYVNVTWLGGTMLMSRESKQVKSVTDDQGRYRIDDLPPGNYVINTGSAEGFLNFMDRSVTLAGRDLENIDFRIKVNGSISGKITDENKEPVPGIVVYLVSPEYYSGVLGYFFKDTAVTNDRGEYLLHRVQAGHPYLVMAEKTANRRMPAWSETPLDPRLRRRAPMRTFFPNSPTIEGGALVTVRPGEHREAVDVEMKKTQNYCVSGTVESPGGAAGMSFGIEGVQPSYGMSSAGGMMGRAPGGQTGPDGKFRVCDLNPGTYRLSAFDREASGPNPGPVNTAMTNVSIRDEDLAGIRLTVSHGIELSGEVVLDGPQPDPPLSAKVNLSFTTLQRSSLPGERPDAVTEIPGTFTMTGLLPSDYGALRAVLRTPGLYIKDARYSTSSVLYEPLHMGSAMAGAMLRIAIGQDGATFSATVATKDGIAVPGIHILAFPVDVTSEAMLQAAMKTGQTNQLGQYKSATLAPGKYAIAAIDDSFDATPASISRIWHARDRFQEVVLAPKGSAQVQLEPITLD